MNFCQLFCKLECSFIRFFTDQTVIDLMSAEKLFDFLLVKSMFLLNQNNVEVRIVKIKSH